VCPSLFKGGVRGGFVSKAGKSQLHSGFINAVNFFSKLTPVPSLGKRGERTVEEGKVCFLIRFFIYQLFQFSTNADFLCAPHFSREGLGRVCFQSGESQPHSGFINAVNFLANSPPTPLLGREGRERWKTERFVF
jgi:hypothetical protein